MLILRMADDLPPELETDLPMSINLLLSDGEAVNLIGDLHGQHTVSGRTFRVTAGSPFRANRGQLPALEEAVLAALELTGSEHLLELYAGVGFFSALLGPHTRRLTLVEGDSDAVDDADFNTSDFDHVDVIESAVEKEDIKRKIFHDVCAVVRPDAIIASNTSSISITRLAASTDRPERFIGIHFMNPVPVM